MLNPFRKKKPLDPMPTFAEALAADPAVACAAAACADATARARAARGRVLALREEADAAEAGIVSLQEKIAEGRAAAEREAARLRAKASQIRAQAVEVERALPAAVARRARDAAVGYRDAYEAARLEYVAKARVRKELADAEREAIVKRLEVLKEESRRAWEAEASAPSGQWTHREVSGRPNKVLEEILAPAPGVAWPVEEAAALLEPYLEMERAGGVIVVQLTDANGRLSLREITMKTAADVAARQRRQAGNARDDEESFIQRRAAELSGESPFVTLLRRRGPGRVLTEAERLAWNARRELPADALAEDEAHAAAARA